MTDNRTTELLRKLLDERGVKWQETINDVNCIFTWWESPTFGMVHAMDNEDGEMLFMACLNNCCFTPEQAIAATLGGEPDEIELTQSYDAGFSNSVMAVYQQLEGIKDYEELQCFIAEYWGEGEGNDER